jgi:hypothetical protein
MEGPCWYIEQGGTKSNEVNDEHSFLDLFGGCRQQHTLSVVAKLQLLRVIWAHNMTWSLKKFTADTFHRKASQYRCPKRLVHHNLQLSHEFVRKLLLTSRRQSCKISILYQKWKTCRLQQVIRPYKSSLRLG